MDSKVFISHSNKDKAIADAICEHLESAGARCWIAPRDIEAGTEWTEGIMRGIASSRVFVLVFSSHANDSEHVPREVSRAFSLHLDVIPFRTEVVEPRDSLAYFLETVHSEVRNFTLNTPVREGSRLEKYGHSSLCRQ